MSGPVGATDMKSNIQEDNDGAVSGFAFNSYKGHINTW